MCSTKESRDVDVYIFHGLEDVVVGLFRGDRMLGYRFVSKRELGEKWVESFEGIMRVSDVKLDDVAAIYLNNSFSTWNASRLITLFVKTIIHFENISFYLREESQDKIDVFSTLKSFCNHRSSFRKVKSEMEISPLYKKCQSINI